MIQLRPYQLDAIQSARDMIRSGRRAPLLVAPTGAGKTYIEAEIARLHLAAGPKNRVLMIAHRRELIGQLANSCLKLGITDIGEITPAARARSTCRLQIASTQTLRARLHAPDATMVIVDECHHYSSDDWSKLLGCYPSVIRVGFTATPMRADGRGMAPAFDSLIVVSSVRELTDLGRLVPCRVIAPPEPLEPPDMSHTPVEAYTAHASGLRTVVFASTVQAANDFADGFRLAGIPVSVIHGELSQSERDAALLAHANGAVLINCMILTEGWDSSETTCCILARGCGSVGTYLQIVGRILRPHPGKEESLLIDLTGRAFWKHGPPDSDREYSLTGKGIRTKGVNKGGYCPVCGQLRAGGAKCDVCEFTFTSASGDINYTGDELAERYARKRKEPVNARVETLARWIAETRDRGYKPTAAIHKYLAVYSHHPSAEFLSLARDLASLIKCLPCATCKKSTATLVESNCPKCARQS